MSDYGSLEVIDGLCKVIEELTDIVNKQAEILAQTDILEELEQELQEIRDKAENELNILEYKMCRIRQNKKEMKTDNASSTDD